MPNSTLPIAIAVLLMSKSAPGGVSPLSGITGRSLGPFGRPGKPIRIAPSSIPELEETLEGMLGALHTIDKFRDYKGLAETLSAGSELVKMLDIAKPTPRAAYLPEVSSASETLPETSTVASSLPEVQSMSNNLPDLSKIMEIAGPMINAINSPR